MNLTRRQALGVGGGMLAALSLPPDILGADGVIEIRMKGTRNGMRVWFDPIGIRVQPGQTIRWVNRDAGNSHTATAYHPANFNHPRRIPEAARPWNSGYLLPDKTFSVTLTRPGVYDYFCIPHESAGMAGRLIVGEPGSPSWLADSDRRVPNLARKAFPPVEEIMEKGVVRRQRAAE